MSRCALSGEAPSDIDLISARSIQALPKLNLEGLSHIIMLGFPFDTQQESKVSITHGTVGHLHPKQPPVKRKPFSSLLNQHFVHKGSQYFDL